MWLRSHQPGAGAVIPAVVHHRRAFGFRFFPYYQPTRSLRREPHSSRWNVNTGWGKALRCAFWL